MDDGKSGTDYLVTLSVMDENASGEWKRAKIVHKGIQHYRVKDGSLILYSEWVEDEFGVASHLDSIYGPGCWFKMERMGN